MVFTSSFHGVAGFLVIFPLCLLACPPPGQYIIPLEQVPVLQAEAASSLQSRSNSSSRLDPRYYYIAPGAVGGGQLWPDNTITYCYQTPAAMTALDANLRSAWDLWRLNGLQDRIQFNQGTNTDCAPGNAANVLTIILAATATLRTSLGKQPIDPNRGLGSTMTLNPSTAIGMQDPVANYAHEIGHAFGLLHEHQRPDVWGADYGGTGQVDQFVFNCPNLADYQARAAILPETSQHTVCQYRGAAAAASFSAYDILPILGASAGIYNAGSVDFYSIMMYASIVGGVGAGAGRAVVYTRADGTQIPFNPVPSAGDILNMNAMYPASAPRSTPCFFWQPCSQFQTLFNGITGCFTGN